MSFRGTYNQIVLSFCLLLLLVNVFLPVHPVAAEEPFQATPPIISEAPSTLAEIFNRGVLRVGVKKDAKPFCYEPKEGEEPIGFDIELINKIKDEWNKKWGVLNKRIERVDFVTIDSNNLISELETGRVDLITCAITHNKERDELIDFSQTYLEDGLSLLYKLDSGITGFNETLNGKFVACKASATACNNITKITEDQGIKLGNVISYTLEGQIKEALIDGSVQAYVRDSILLQNFIKHGNDDPNDNFNTEDYKLVESVISKKEPYAIGLRNGDSQLRDAVNFALQTLVNNQEYRLTLTNWFQDSIPPYDVQLFQNELSSTLSPTITIPVSAFDKLTTERSFIAGVRPDLCDGRLSCRNTSNLDEPVGFEPDLIREFARRWLGTEAGVKFEFIQSEQRIPWLLANWTDIAAAAMTQTNDRDEQIDFSQTYFLAKQKFLVRVNDFHINSIEDLHNKTVACIDKNQGHDLTNTTTSCQNLRQAISDTQKIFPSLNIDIRYAPGYLPDLLLTKKNNGAYEIDAFTADDSFFLDTLEKYPELTIEDGPLPNAEPYGLGLRANDGKFRDLINFTLQAMKDDGTYAAIYHQWFPSDCQKKPYEIERWPDGKLALPGTYLGINYNKVAASPENPCPEFPVADDSLGCSATNCYGDYIVQPGDTLGDISKRCYGNLLEYNLIFDDTRLTNPEFTDYNNIAVGMVLKIRIDKRLKDAQGCDLE